PHLSLLIRYPLPLLYVAPPTPAIVSLSLHDALPISQKLPDHGHFEYIIQFLQQKVFLWDFDANIPLSAQRIQEEFHEEHILAFLDRKSTRLNSSHVKISYAVFCLKKKR